MDMVSAKVRAFSRRIVCQIETSARNSVKALVVQTFDIEIPNARCIPFRGQVGSGISRIQEGEYILYIWGIPRQIDHAKMLTIFFHSIML